MAKPDFQWWPTIGSQLSSKPRVTVTKFGDGYEARVPVAININPESWTLTIDADRTTVLAAKAFLDQQTGVTAFTWSTHPFGNTTALFVCREWSVSSERGYLILKATFEQVFEQ